MPAKKVSEKSTKQELWSAYNELMGDLDQDSFEFVSKKEENTVPDSLKKLSELKLTLSQRVDQLSEELMSEIEETKNFKKEFVKQKEALIEALNIKKQALDKEIEKVKADWISSIDQQKVAENDADRAKKLECQREEEEYLYNLKIKRRNEQEEFSRKTVVKEQELKEREVIIETKEQELKELKKQVENIPAIINSEVEKAKAGLRKELQLHYDQEIKNITVAKDNEIKILEIKNANLQSQITMQTTDIDALKKQVADLTKQLKEMATTAIENRGQNMISPKVENER